MNKPLICMTLTGATLAENQKLVKKYEKQIDIAELRADYLAEDEQFHIRKFPALVNLPCILTIRRDVDGGLFAGGEFSRTSLFARSLAFVNPDQSKKFAYVDFEEDYYVSSVQEAAHSFNVRIIRSFHNMTEPVFNLKEKCVQMRKTGYEIPKIAFAARSVSDVQNMFKESESMTDFEHIFCAMGAEGFPSRILAVFSNSFLTYVSPKETLANTHSIGHVDPFTLNDLYNFRSITKKTNLYGIIGWPLTNIFSSSIQNTQYRVQNIDNVYVPVRSKNLSEALAFCEYMGFKGLTVADPYKETIMPFLSEKSPEVIQTGVCDTIVRKNNKWIGYSSDSVGFRKSLLEFLGIEKLKRKKIAVIGDTPNANMAVWVLKQFGAKVCVFGKSLEKIKSIAEKYGCEYCLLDARRDKELSEYSYLIIQTTVYEEVEADSAYYETDLLSFYSFKGPELVFDFNFSKPFTELMKRAVLAGCRVSNGSKMFEYHAYEQFKLFTGLEHKKL